MTRLEQLQKQCDEINEELEKKGIQVRAQVNPRMMRIEHHDLPKEGK